MRIVINWVLSAVSLFIVAHVIRGFELAGFPAALLAAIVVGFANATLGFLLKVLTFPITLVTFGVFWFVINAVILKLAAALVPGFSIHGFLPAFLGAVVLSLVNLFMRLISKELIPEERRIDRNSF